MSHRIVTGLLAMGLLAGCSLFRGGPAPDLTYVLRAAPAGDGPAAVTGVLSVMRPVVQPGLDLDRIALVRADNELHYYAASRWGETLPRVVTALALQSLAGGGGFATVVSTERAVVGSNFELLLTVRHFEAMGQGEAAPVARVAFECVLMSGVPRRVLGRCDAEATEPAAANRMGAIVAALERAAQAALGRVREQAVAAAGTVPAPAEAPGRASGR
jgi:cholesterol transport system auxiliary component